VRQPQGGNGFWRGTVESVNFAVFPVFSMRSWDLSSSGVSTFLAWAQFSISRYLTF
jgi:hypothetical protein